MIDEPNGRANVFWIQRDSMTRKSEPSSSDQFFVVQQMLDRRVLICGAMPLDIYYTLTPPSTPVRTIAHLPPSRPPVSHRRYLVVERQARGIL